MIDIDGSGGEGGGQILRTSVALSAYTGQAFRIHSIRAGRDVPGLRPQHLSSVLAAARLCNAKVEGGFVGSGEVFFRPGKISAGKIKVDVGTAGSVTMVLQALLFPSFFAEKEVVIELVGGTDVRWSPSIDYLRHVTLPILAKAGFRAEIELIRRGYYPAGGGKVKAVVHPSLDRKPFDLTDPGAIKEIKGLSHAHVGLEKAEVALRQAKTARNILFNHLVNKGFTGKIDMGSEYVQAASFGSGITLWAETENSVLGSDSVGERGKRAELVAEDAADGLVSAIDSGAPLDRYMGDQIIPYLAVAGGVVRVAEITSHARTNVDIVNRFGFEVEIEGNRIKASL